MPTALSREDTLMVFDANLSAVTLSLLCRRFVRCSVILSLTSAGPRLDPAVFFRISVSH